jgi:hypothetical protein
MRIAHDSLHPPTMLASKEGISVDSVRSIQCSMRRVLSGQLPCCCWHTTVLRCVRQCQCQPANYRQHLKLCKVQNSKPRCCPAGVCSLGLTIPLRCASTCSSVSCTNDRQPDRQSCNISLSTASTSNCARDRIASLPASAAWRSPARCAVLPPASMTGSQTGSQPTAS